MIGQERILDKVNRWKEVPRFIILNGKYGCGKKTLAKYIADRFNFQLILIGTKIDEIREMIDLAKQSSAPILFVIDNGNKMSIGAENTLLKTTEEAPNNTYIILTVENKDLLLPTIISRGEVFNFQNYQIKDFHQILVQKELLKKSETIYERLTYAYPNLSYVDSLSLKDAEELVEFCEKISKYIREANGANAFKITEKIKVKDGQEGYDLFQFIYCLKNVCNKALLDAIQNKDDIEYNYQLSYIQIITKLEQMLSNPLFNKSYILDKLIIDFKAVYF